jgi:hypothetical protein
VEPEWLLIYSTRETHEEFLDREEVCLSLFLEQVVSHVPTYNYSYSINIYIVSIPAIFVGI